MRTLQWVSPNVSPTRPNTWRLEVGRMTKITTRLGETPNFGQTLSLLLQLPSYFCDAACSEANPQIFDGETLSDVLAAKKVCGLCPIMNLCLDWAARTQDSGVWGGMTPLERKKYNRGKGPIDIGEVRMLETNRTRLLSSTPASKLAEEFEVTERTIYRWRKKIRTTKQAS